MRVQISFYGREVVATDIFKYLGITLNANGTVSAHIDARANAFARAANALLGGLRCVPSFPHSFMIYLWNTLVVPVGAYGMELFTWSPKDAQPLLKEQAHIWRRMLQASGRAPLDSVHALLKVDCCSLLWRINRVALFVRLLNSPADSLQHVVLIVLRDLQTPWYNAAINDLRLVLPTLSVRLVTGLCGLPLLQSNGWWTEEGLWTGAHPSQLHVDMLGHRTRTLQRRGTDAHELRLIKWLVRDICGRLKRTLRRDWDRTALQQLTQRRSDNPCSKTAFLAEKLTRRGPPVHVAIDWIGPQAHRAALTSMLVGDWFLGAYAGNYFARNLLPSQTIHKLQAAQACGDTSRVCLSCWHTRRRIALEDLAHVVWDCPHYSSMREDFVLNLHPELGRALARTLSSHEKLMMILESFDSHTWEKFGVFAHRIRQSRRKLRTEFGHLSARMEHQSFTRCRDAWRASGRKVCRHGVFFRLPPARTCPCLEPYNNDAWHEAKFMPAIDEGLKTITIAPFDLEQLFRLGVLQAEMRRRQW